MPLIERFGEYVRACFTGLWIESHEHQDALMAIAQLCRREHWRLATWDIEQGLRVEGTKVEANGSDSQADLNTCHQPLDGLWSHASTDLPNLGCSCISQFLQSQFFHQPMRICMSRCAASASRHRN